jgi:ATP-dependent Clp protease ATP-binding subunit ClpC
MSDRAFDKFTKRAKQVLQIATEEARAFNHPYIGTEHLLLGLIREGEGVAARVLDELGVKLVQARHAVEFIVGHGEGPPRQDLELTARAKKVIAYAVEEAKRLNHTTSAPNTCCSDWCVTVRAWRPVCSTFLAYHLNRCAQT